MTGDVLQALDSFIYTLLAADATLTGLLGGAGKIVQELAPESATEPLLVYSFVSALVTDAVGQGTAGRIMVRPLFQLRAVTQGSGFAQAAAIAGRADVLLTGARGSLPASNLFVADISQTEPIRYVEVGEGGLRYNHQGARYRAIITAIT